MKGIIITAVFFAMANQGKAQLPQCLIQKISVGYDYSHIRVALYENDTCYVIDHRTWDPAKISRLEIQMINRERGKPEYAQPQVYNKECKSLKFIRNKDLLYTSKIYRWQELDTLIKQSIVAANHIKALLPQCIIKKVSVGDDFLKIKIALYKNDTCYVIHRRTWDPSKVTRHEIQMINMERGKREYAQPEVYNKKCNALNFIKNKDLMYTSETYSWWELEHLIKN
jgi:hypothetical protein